MATAVSMKASVTGRVARRGAVSFGGGFMSGARGEQQGVSSRGRRSPARPPAPGGKNAPLPRLPSHHPRAPGHPCRPGLDDPGQPFGMPTATPGPVLTAARGVTEGRRASAFFLSRPALAPRPVAAAAGRPGAAAHCPPWAAHTRGRARTGWTARPEGRPGPRQGRALAHARVAFSPPPLILILSTPTPTLSRPSASLPPPPAPSGSRAPRPPPT